MERHSNHKSAIPPMNPVKNHIIANACGPRAYSDYCYLYNIALNAILDYFNCNQPQVHPIFQETSNISNFGSVKANSEASLKTSNRSLHFLRGGIKVKSFAKHLASQPNIILKTNHKKADQKLFQETEKPYKEKLLKCLERRKKAQEAKERLIKARVEWREATVYKNTPDFQK